MGDELESLEDCEVDLTSVNFTVQVASSPCYDVQILSPDVTIDFSTLAGSGPPGEAATITVGSTVSSAPGSPAQVVNVGDSQHAIFNFTIPTGASGPPGNQGVSGSPGVAGPAGNSAYTTSTADFIVPPVGSTVTAYVGDTGWAVPGEFVYVQDAGGTGVAGTMKVISKTLTSLLLQNF